MEGARDLSYNFAPFQNFDICSRSKVTGDPDGQTHRQTDTQTDRRTKRSHKYAEATNKLKVSSWNAYQGHFIKKVLTVITNPPILKFKI